MMRHTTCPSPVALTREHSIGASAATEEHLNHCEACTEQWAKFDQLLDLGRDLPMHSPTANKTETIRAAVLNSFTQSSSSSGSFHKWRWVIGAIAASIIAIIGVFYFQWTPRSNTIEVNDRSTFKATVHSHPAATLFRAGSQPDEIVRLTGGTITVSVKPLEKGERFRVVTGDAEVEVRGTIFDVVVEDDSLLEVSVISGRVDVRPAKGASVTLGPGERWGKPSQQTPPTADPEVADNPAPEASAEMLDAVSPLTAKTRREMTQSTRRQRGGDAYEQIDRSDTETDSLTDDKADEDEAPHPKEPSPQVLHPSETAFRDGWSALKDNAYADSIEAFTEAINTPGAGKIAEDASFWRCVAYARLGRHQKALHALQRFVGTYPNSPRAGEASVMLGWKLLEAGDLDSAEKHFRKATLDKNRRIRISAEQGLSDITSKRRLQ